MGLETNMSAEEVISYAGPMAVGDASSSLEVGGSITFIVTGDTLFLGNAYGRGDFRYDFSLTESAAYDFSGSASSFDGVAVAYFNAPYDFDPDTGAYSGSGILQPGTYSLAALCAGSVGGNVSFHLSITPLLAADFDEDRDVDSTDLASWKTNFGLATGATHAQGDATADGVVNGDDWIVWQRQLGETSIIAASYAVPEHSAITLSAVSLLAFAQLRRRHLA